MSVTSKIRLSIVCICFCLFPSMPVLSQAGHSKGGQGPVVGGKVYLFATGVSGGTPISLLHGSGVSVDGSGNGYVTTGSDGSFSITGLYAAYCPSADSLVYVLVNGGASSGGSNNPADTIVSAMPVTCGNLPNIPFIQVNELTTVAAAYALAPFANVTTEGFSSGSSNVQQMAAAFSVANSMVDSATGEARTALLPGNGYVPYQKLNTVGDILASCIENGTTACASLFSAVTPSGGSAPGDTLQAVLNMALHPYSNVNAIFGLVPSPSVGGFTPTLAAAPADWNIFISYPTSGYMRPITFSHAMVPNTDQVDFPVLVAGTYPYLASTANGGQVLNSNGYDIVFASDAAGQNLLDYEIDSYNPETGAVAFWIRIPQLSHTADTTIYMFYGIPSIASSLENKLGVWSNNYLSVYHFGNGTSVGLNDSGVEEYSLSGSAMAVSGAIGGGVSFDGDPNVFLAHEDVPAYPSGQSAVTLEAWAKMSPGDSGEEIIGYGANDADGSRAGLGSDGTNILLEFENVAVVSPQPSDNNWHQYVGVYGGGSLDLSSSAVYVDGTSQSNSLISGTTNITTTELKIGGVPTETFCCAWTGSIDEVRVSQGVRSSDWIATEYANQSSPSSFYSVGSPSVSGGAAPTTPTLTITTSADPATVGQQVTLTATISSGASGTVSFYDGGTTLIGTATITGATANFTSSALAIGTHSIAAYWPGAGNLNPITSSAIMQTVASPTGQAGGCTSGIVDQDNTNDGGDDYTDVEQIVCLYADNQAGVDTSVETDNDSYQNSGDLETLWVYGVGTEAQVYATYGSSLDGASTISDSNLVYGNLSDTGGDPAIATSVAPGGYATYGLQGFFFECFQEPGNYDGPYASNQCTWSAQQPFPPGGSGSGVYPSYGLYLQLPVGPPSQLPTPTVTLSTSSTTINYGITVTFTATISDGPTSGELQFYDGSTYLGSGWFTGTTAVLIAGPDGFAPLLAAGSHQITAVFSSDGSFNGATSNTVAETVNSVITPVAVTVNCSPNPTLYNVQPSTCVAHVSSGTGTIALSYNDISWTSGPVDTNGNFSATAPVGALPPGTYTITAAYSGDSTHSAASGSTVGAVVSSLPTLSLNCSPTTILLGDATTCTANVPVGTTGSVAFTVDGSAWESVAIDAGGNAVANGVLTPSTVGQHNIVASYSASGNTVSQSASVTVNGSTLTAAQIYEFNISAFAPNGNVTAYTDTVNGTWSNLTYDPLNRLTGATQAPVGSPTQFFCWAYDSFGNRTVQGTASVPLQSDSSTCRPATNYTPNNQVAADPVSGLPSYDAAGNITADTNNNYIYDDEGRICAVEGPAVLGGFTWTQYIYDAEGNRVAKGTISNPSAGCDTTQNGFVVISGYVLGQGGEQVTEMAGDGEWVHTNVFVGGTLLATYDNSGVHFHITDWLGSTRVQTDYLGRIESTYQNLPFGEMVPNNSVFLGATEHHFTGKERDTESGNDYFGARYYNSATGRFLSPDWSAKEEPVPYAKLDNPQTLNLYSYVVNNPVKNRDADGHICVFGIGNTCGGAPSPPPPPSSNQPTVAGAIPPRQDTVGPATGPMPTPRHVGETSGLGITAGGEAGTIQNGVSASGNLNVALSVKDGKPSVALVDNHVGVAYSGDKSVGTTQDRQPVVAGMSGGISVTGFVSNAQSANDLIGPFQTRTLNLPFVSLQLSTSADIHVFSMSVGASGGYSYSNITTETTVGCIAGCN